MKNSFFKKISVISYESSVGRTTVAKSLFDYAIIKAELPVHLIGYDLDKPDLLKIFDKVKFSAEEHYADFPLIDKDHCKYCGACLHFCDYAAIVLDRQVPSVNILSYRCEACGACIEGCSIHGISTRTRLTGYVLQGRINGNFITIGKAVDSHNFLIPLISALNKRVSDGSVAICDMEPGVSAYLAAAIRHSSLAVIVVKPAQGWTRNIQFLLDLLHEQNIPYGILINKYRGESGFLVEVERFCLSEKAGLLGIIPYCSPENEKKTSAFLVNGSENESIFAPIWENIIKTFNDMM